MQKRQLASLNGQKPYLDDKSPLNIAKARQEDTAAKSPEEDSGLEKQVTSSPAPVKQALTPLPDGEGNLSAVRDPVHCSPVADRQPIELSPRRAETALTLSSPSGGQAHSGAKSRMKCTLNKVKLASSMSDPAEVDIGSSPTKSTAARRVRRRIAEAPRPAGHGEEPASATPQASAHTGGLEQPIELPCAQPTSNNLTSDRAKAALPEPGIGGERPASPRPSSRVQGEQENEGVLSIKEPSGVWNHKAEQAMQIQQAISEGGTAEHSEDFHASPAIADDPASVPQSQPVDERILLTSQNQEVNGIEGSCASRSTEPIANSR